MGSFFRSLNEKTYLPIASMAKDYGIRPSAIFEWNEPDDWMERLSFDLYVKSVLDEREYKEHKKAMRKSR
jgi:uncharacterized protein YjcR